MEQQELPVLDNKKSLYPLRPSDDVDVLIDEIDKLVIGEEKPLVLSEVEKKELLEFEGVWGETLEKLFMLKVRNSNIYLDYFLTDAGRIDLARLFVDESIPNNLDGLRRFIFKRSQVLAVKDSELRLEIFSKARNYATKLFTNAVLTEDGTPDFSKAKPPDKIEVLFDSENLLKKIEGLRGLRRIIHLIFKELDNETGSNFGIAKKEILKIYLARINELLLELYSNLYSIAHKAELVGFYSLTTEEKKLLRKYALGKNKSEKSLSRIDRMIHGASKEYNHGEKYQINPFIEQRAKVLQAQRVIEELNRDKLIREKGLDPEKVLKVDVDFNQRSIWGERLLKRYGFLSSEPAITYSSDRVGPAKDGLWQFVGLPNRDAMAVRPTQKIVADSAHIVRDVISALVVSCDHEIEGHVIQHVNREKVPLRLFDVVGGDRRSIMAEGGAMWLQNKLTQEFFGFRSIPHPHYIAAMKTKLEGGDFVACVKSFYESAMAEFQQEFDSNDDVQKKNFKKRSEANLKLAYDRVKRIFNTPTFQSSTAYLTASKPTVYLEQEIILEKLEAKKLVKLAFIGGMNLPTIKTLLKLGLLDVTKILEPQYYTREIWEEIKGQYSLDSN